jgi:cytochrome c biogenesis protein CcmG, thiol:disulfide interchange protein DsbE
MRTMNWIGVDLVTRASGWRTPRCALVFALTLAACGGNAQPAASAASDGPSIVGQEAPDAEFAALQGSGKIKLSSLRGKVVLLDFWASWCAPCQEELPLLDDMAARLKGKDIQIVGLSLDENKADAQRFLGQKSSWSLTLGHDPEQSVADQFKPPKMPTSYVIDRKGVVRQMNAGFERADAKKIEAQLLDLASAG